MQTVCSVARHSEVVGEFFRSLPKAAQHILVDTTCPVFKVASRLLEQSPRSITGHLLAYASRLHRKVPEPGVQSLEEVIQHFISQLDGEVQPEAIPIVASGIEYRCKVSFLLGYATRAAQQKGILDKLPELPMVE